MNENKKYESYRIPSHNPLQENEVIQISNQIETLSYSQKVLDFAEIEIDYSEDNNSTKCTPQSQTIEPVIDEKRIIFNEMRQIARDNQSPFISYSKFYDKKVQYHISKIFYKQAVFMKDFEDNFTEKVAFSSYFPYYQMMSYDQLRTYFTWRTNVRNGNIANTSLSYAFIYIYELLNNIGVSNPKDGLDKLMFFWNSYKVYNTVIDKYIIMWIKDYHIYYELPKSFKEFISDNNLMTHYPKTFFSESDINDNFELYCSISKYDIRQSAFYNDQTCQLINDCFTYVIRKLRRLFKSVDININDFIFYSTNKKSDWTPFKKALFFPCRNQPDRQIVLSEKEIYICSQNKWTFSTVITMESGKQLVSYILKHMESVLRKVTHYQYNLSANTNKIDSEIIQKLNESGYSLEKIINDVVLEFYAEINRTVVSVNETALNKIRQEALGTQEKLIVPEAESPPHIRSAENDDAQLAFITSPEVQVPPVRVLQEIPPSLSDKESNFFSDGWTSLRNMLSTTEMKALAIILLEGNIKQFANENGIMLEVLADSINEKAIDYIGDYILELDDDIIIFDEYKEKIIKMVEI